MVETDLATVLIGVFALLVLIWPLTLVYILVKWINYNRKIEVLYYLPIRSESGFEAYLIYDGKGMPKDYAHDFGFGKNHVLLGTGSILVPDGYFRLF